MFTPEDDRQAYLDGATDFGNADMADFAVLSPDEWPATYAASNYPHNQRRARRAYEMGMVSAGYRKEH